MSNALPPWAMAGESMLGLARWDGPRTVLPAGLHRMPGPVLVFAMCITNSPVGSYTELSIGEPARLGTRPGWCFTTMVHNTAAARRGINRNWGFPTTEGALSWQAKGDERILRWDDRGVVVRGVAGRVVVPWLMPLRALQRRHDGAVTIPSRLRGRGRFGGIEVTTPDDDPLRGVAGDHPGLIIGSFLQRREPARHATGLLSTFTAPLRPVEPALHPRS